MPENLRADTPSRRRASADCCAEFRSKSNSDGRGLECETVKPAGSSRISTSPRRTRVASVVRGTSLRPGCDCRLATGTLPPEAVRASTSLRWFSLSFPSANFRIAIFMVRVASCAAEMSSRTNHFLRTIPARMDLETRVAERSVSSRTSAPLATVVPTSGNDGEAWGTSLSISSDPDAAR